MSLFQRTSGFVQKDGLVIKEMIKPEPGAVIGGRLAKENIPSHTDLEQWYEELDYFLRRYDDRHIDLSDLEDLRNAIYQYLH